MLTVNKELIRVKHVHAQKMRIRSKNSKQKKKLTFQKKNIFVRSELNF